ncbi:MAG: phosphoglucosamine mutase [Alphaproteobacteria bacterium]
MPKYFGTDGIRGQANGPVLRPDVLVRIGQAAGQVVGDATHNGKRTVVIGKDTRLSGYMIESALQAGFTSVGFNVLLVGPLPTPAVSMLTRSLRADLGVMITASHNPYADNGIKFFQPDGVKLQADAVARMEHLIDNPSEIELASPDHIGRALRVEDAVGRYIEFIKGSLPRAFGLHGLKIVVDCANGAAYKIAPRVLWELGGQVFKLGVDPDGFNINKDVGATAPQALSKAVVHHKADIGLALDGDADRLIVVDETGAVVDGDFVIAALGQHLHRTGKLQGGGVVGTVMSNIGLERFMEGLGIKLIRTAVGDHYVEAAMREGGYNVGGEQSGHLILRDYATTGDGLLAALQLLAFLQESKAKTSDVTRLYTPWPQKLENIKLGEGVDAGAVLASEGVQASIKAAEAALGKAGRVLVRKSGTEPLIRVMVEAESEQAMQAAVDGICAAVREAV